MDPDFPAELNRIHSNTRRKATAQETSKKRKVSRLTESKRTKELRRRRKKKTSGNMENTINNTLTNNTVVNVSNVSLSEGEELLLSRGLSFCPRPSRIDQFRLKDDIKDFTRRLRLREFFHDPDEDNTTPIPPFRQKSKWTPPTNREPALENYIVSVEREIHRQVDRGPPYRSTDNVTSLERKALSSLRKRSDIVIKPADKGSATVVMSRDDYLVRVMKHLNNTQFYEKLSEDPTERFSEEITNYLTGMFERNVLDRDTFGFLRPKDVRTSRFYILPKLHKPGIPGRPIVSSCGAPTERISKFIDYHLSPLVKKVPSYVKDTNDFLSKLREIRVTPESLLVTLDVTSLYTNIPHKDGVDACREALNTRGVLDPPTDDLINLINLVLERNNFAFNDVHYLQKHGTAMGTRMAPSYANLFMGQLEGDLLEQAERKPTTWWRYIDDIFAIWPHGEEHLRDFIQAINSRHDTIKFTAEWSNESVTFLDTEVIRDGNRLITDLHIKPTDTHQYLHQRSCHPLHCKNSIAYSQALRIRRICSRHTDYLQHVEELKGYLVRRGYDEKTVHQRINKATGRDRDSLLTPHESTTKQTVPFVVTYHPDLPNLTRVLLDHQCVIDTSPRLKEALPNPPLVAYRRPPQFKRSFSEGGLWPS